MESGKVKFFNETKGFGFIVVDSTNQEVFVHQTEIIAEGFRTLKDGQAVTFEIVEDKKGARATNVKAL